MPSPVLSTSVLSTSVLSTSVLSTSVLSNYCGYHSTSRFLNWAASEETEEGRPVLGDGEVGGGGGGEYWVVGIRGDQY